MFCVTLNQNKLHVHVAVQSSWEKCLKLLSMLLQPMEKGVAFHFTNLNFLHQRMIGRSLFEILLGQWFWRRFLAAHDVFSYSATVFLWEMVWPFNLKKLKLSSPRCFVSRWVWIVQEEFLKIVNLFSLFYYNYLPLVKSVILQQKLEFHSIKDTLCLVWLKLAQWFWRDRLIWYI